MTDRQPPDGHSGNAGDSEAETRDLGRVLRWMLFGRRAPWPRSAPPDGPPEPIEAATEPAVSVLGHATVLARIGRRRLLADPVFGHRAGPLGRLGPRRVRPPAVPLDDLAPIDVVLVSHDHYDHLEAATIRRLARRDRPSFVTGVGVDDRLRQWGATRVHALEWWESVEFEGLRITFTPARHFSGRGLRDRNRTRWGGFVAEGGGARIYFAGDSGWGDHFAAIRERFGPPDLALLPIGAYEPRWFMGPVHIDPDEAVRAHLALGARRSVAIHFGTFRLSDEGIDRPAADLARAREAHGVDPEAFVVPRFGAVYGPAQVGAPVA